MRLSRSLYAASRRKPTARGETSPTQTLASLFREDANRVEVVSERLCDDIIEYLAPTLEQHKGCTLLDVHPGACIWSRKLHEFLQPKRHILMEPESKYHEAFIKPLLDLPGSKYRHTLLPGAHPKNYLNNYSRVLCDPNLVEEPIGRLPEGDPGRRQFNPKILLTGNLARAYKVHRVARSSRILYQSLVIGHMNYAGLSNEMMHQHGLVRMLWWIPESFLENYFTFTVKNRRTFAAMLGMGGHVDCTVGFSSVRDIQLRNVSRKVRSRIPGLDLRKEKEVDWKMEQAGMTVPEGRDVLAHRDKESDIDVLYQSPLEIKYSSVDEIEKALAAEESRCEHIHRRFSMKTARQREAQVKSLPTETELRQNMRFPEAFAASKPVADFKSINASRMALAVDAVLCAVQLEANFKELEEKSKTPDFHSALYQRLVSHSKTVEDLIQGGHYSTRFRETVHDITEEIIAFFIDPPTLLRDRRSYATLKAEESDYWPKRPLNLLDFHPSTRDLSVPDTADSVEASKVLQEFIKHLFLRRTIALTESLDAIAPNAAQDLIPAVPAITDARKGGRMDPRLVITRTVTEEMLEGLVKAFIEWPFRPQTWQLELAVAEAEGPSTMSPADEDDETDG
ncbi:hypothetical protein MBLNU230_g3588t1 [Neophaeotheca triangularis]